VRLIRRNHVLTSVTMTFVVALIFLPVVNAQTQKPQTQSLELFEKIKALDNTFFDAFNKCEIAKMESLFAEDIEFYHEKRGVLENRKSVMEAFSNNLCGDKNNKVRRELVEGSLKVYPIPNYGAMAVGEHRFYLTQSGQTEKLDGIGTFTNLWQLKDGEWRMSRVFSYGFRPK
jgi:uncharacterized protein DUF4440